MAAYVKRQPIAVAFCGERRVSSFFLPLLVASPVCKQFERCNARALVKRAQSPLRAAESLVSVRRPTLAVTTAINVCCHQFGS